MIRCMFHLSLLAFAAASYPDGLPLRTATLAPRYDSGSEENKAFWEATPTGEMEIVIPTESSLGDFDPQPGLVGGAFYIDLEPLAEGGEEAGAWTLEPVKQGDSSIQVRLTLPWKPGSGQPHGSLRMTINNKAAWPRFVGQDGRRFRVRLSPVAPAVAA